MPIYGYRNRQPYIDTYVVPIDIETYVLYWRIWEVCAFVRHKRILYYFLSPFWQSYLPTWMIYFTWQIYWNIQCIYTCRANMRLPIWHFLYTKVRYIYTKIHTSYRTFDCIKTQKPYIWVKFICVYLCVYSVRTQR